MPTLLSSNYVVDENKSVLWNREEVKRLNKERQKVLDNYRNVCNKVDKKFGDDCISAVVEEIGVTYKSATKIYQKAYTNKHVNWHRDVYYRLQELSYLILEILLEEKCK